jgi:hypothetical protein
MRVFADFALFIVLAIGCAVAQQPWPSSSHEQQTELPAASGTPEPQGAPELLPDSSTLPAPPPELRLPAPVNLLAPENGSRSAPPAQPQLSPQEQARARARLLELRPIAERTSRAQYLLKLANGALSDEAKRQFMRAYQHTVCLEMRRLDPKIRQVINDYERTQIRHLAQGPSRLVVASRKSSRATKRSRTNLPDH